LNKLTSANEDFTSVLELDNKHVQAAYSRAAVHNKMGLFERAVEGERAKRASLVTEECEAPCEIFLHGYIHYY